MAKKKAIKKKATKKAPATKKTASVPPAKDNIDGLGTMQLTASVELGRTHNA